MMPRNTASGFTLLELLVVLAIMGALLGLVTPNLTFDQGRDALQRDAQQFRVALQKVIDESWLTGQSKYLLVQDNVLQVYSMKDDEWALEAEVYQFDEALEHHLQVPLSQLQAAKKALDITDKADWLTLSNGEYLPMEWQLSLGDDSVLVTGDGINALSVK